MRRARFGLGQILITAGALMTCVEAGVNPADLLNRHLAGDWGDLCGEDRAANDLALENGSRLLSAYTLPAGERLWIITEADRSATTLLLPSEY